MKKLFAMTLMSISLGIPMAQVFALAANALPKDPDRNPNPCKLGCHSPLPDPFPSNPFDGPPDGGPPDGGPPDGGPPDGGPPDGGPPDGGPPDGGVP
jgi:hypothetical protein